MRAALQVGVDQVEVVDVPTVTGEDNTAVVQVQSSGICGSDLHMYHDPRRTGRQSVWEGHEVAGRVVHLPDNYSGSIRLGDLVALDTICLGKACGQCVYCVTGRPFHCPARHEKRLWGGGFAETIRRQTEGLFVLPAGVTAEQGALVEPLAVGVHAIRLVRMPAGASVVILGAGTIGLMTLLAARGLGAGAVHITARHPHQAALAEALGATTVLPSDAPDTIERVRELTGGMGADYVIETVGGHADTVNEAWDLARIQGTVVVLGIFPERVPVNLLRPVDKEIFAAFPCCYGTIDGRHDYDVAIELIASGRAPVEKLVTHRYGLEEAALAFRTAADKSTGSIKVHLVL